jgi:TolB-like protein
VVGRQLDPLSTAHPFRVGILLGTLAYMSPEQTRGKAVDARTDIFSFGVLLYEMVTGRAPFEGETTSDIIASILRTDPPPLTFRSPEAPAELERIVTKALAKNQDERYQTAQDLLIDLKRLKQQREIDGEIERSRSGDAITRPAVETHSAQTAAPPTARETRSVSNAPSAEYIATGTRQHKRGFALAAILITAIIGITAALFFGTGANRIDSLAVLPFLNADDDRSAEYLSDGISESIIYDLSRLTALKVIPRSSVFRYKGTQTDPQTVARELGVRAVFTGTIRLRGDNLLISAELIDAKENRLLGDSNTTTDCLTLLPSSKRSRGTFPRSCGLICRGTKRGCWPSGTPRVATLIRSI